MYGERPVSFQSCGCSTDGNRPCLRLAKLQIMMSIKHRLALSLRSLQRLLYILIQLCSHGDVRHCAFVYTCLHSCLKVLPKGEGAMLILRISKLCCKGLLSLEFEACAQTSNRTHLLVRFLCPRSYRYAVVSI